MRVRLSHVVDFVLITLHLHFPSKQHPHITRCEARAPSRSSIPITPDHGNDDDLVIHSFRSKSTTLTRSKGIAASHAQTAERG